jgi:FKBP-type peptidyl-prolyl cis-trans isomerase FklB
MIHTKLIGISLICLGFAFTASAQKGKKQTNPTNNMNTELKNETDTVSYGLGLLISKNLASQGFDSINIDAFIKAMKDVMAKQPTKISEQQAQTLVQNFAAKKKNAEAEKNLKEGIAFLEKNKLRKEVITTASGLQYEILKQGTGEKPKDLNTQVTAHYHGTLIDGRVFDSSVNRGQPFKTRVGGVIKAWQEALMLMNVGTKLRIYCPSELAYGPQGAGQMIGPNTVLIFEMELLSIDN